ncbi:hypothetical protein GBAR_LOCUS2947 [Geodia barretti]|uniref:Uncharacterized protein n=1 Tax=Geodia barretti TaxID=519541 RepID=A0AA35R1E8_GEOBA|nr:hypothetical protein GBAR_LOCUS2947 [Geodia barretti]
MAYGAERHPHAYGLHLQRLTVDSHPSYRMGSSPSQRAPLEGRVPPTLASEATGSWGAQLARVSPLGSGLGNLSAAESSIVAFSLPSPTVESQPLGLRLMPRQLTAATEGLYCRG